MKNVTRLFFLLVSLSSATAFAQTTDTDYVRSCKTIFVTWYGDKLSAVMATLPPPILGETSAQYQERVGRPEDKIPTETAIEKAGLKLCSKLQ